MSTRYKGSLMSSTAAATSTSAASGIWKSNEVMQGLQAILWPLPAAIDPYWTSVSLLLHGDGTNGAQNNTFIDSSSNNFSISRNGTTTQGSFNPFSQPAPYSVSVNGGSGYFNGSTDSLSAPANSAFSFNADFTVEGWFYNTSFPGSGSYNHFYDFRLSGSSGSGFTIGQYSSSGQIVIYSGSGQVFAGTTNPSLNTWNHFAMVRSGSVVTVYLNGISIGTWSTSTNFTDNNCVIGRYGLASGEFFTGYFSSLRVVKGTAVYTSSFIPSTTPLTAISGTSLLLNFTNAGIYDNAMVNDLITVGTSQVSTSVFKFGTGSMSFNGSGSWLTAIDSTKLQMGTGDFTIEGWVYLNSAGVAYGIIGKGTSSTGWSVNVTSGNKLQFSYSALALTGATSLSASTWYYFAIVRSGSSAGNVKIYLNGSVDATSLLAINDNFNQTDTLYVGADRGSSNSLNGYIDDLRLTKGVARTISLPTAAFANQ